MEKNCALLLSFKIKIEFIQNEMIRRIVNDPSFNHRKLFSILDEDETGFITAPNLISFLHKNGINKVEPFHLVFLIYPFIKNKSTHSDVYSKEGSRYNNRFVRLENKF
jgi:hypothetical protein